MMMPDTLICGLQRRNPPTHLGQSGDGSFGLCGSAARGEHHGGGGNVWGRRRELLKIDDAGRTLSVVIGANARCVFRGHTMMLL
jgi:hypothetical protein